MATPALQVQGMHPGSGPAGTTVNIRGQFPAGATVTVDRREVPSTAGSRGGLRFVIPNLPEGSHRIGVRAGRDRVDVGDFVLGAGTTTTVPVPVPVPVAVPTPVPNLPPGDRGRHRRWGHESFEGRTLISGFEPRGGPPGTRVTIYGRGLEHQNELYFRGQAIAFAHSGPHSMSFVIPQGASSGPITIAGAGDNRRILVGMFQVSQQAPPPPTVRRDRFEEFRRGARARWAARRAQLAATEQARLQALQQAEAQLRASREQRRRERWAAIRAAMQQAFLARPDVQDELALHAERTAQLARMQRLAELGQRENLAIRIDVLRQAENQRHEQRISDLRAAPIQ